MVTHCANVSHFKDGWAVNLVWFFSQKDKRIPNLNASIAYMQAWGQWGWTVRLLKLSTHDHGKYYDKWLFRIMHFVCFSVWTWSSEILGKLAKFSVQLSFGKTQMPCLCTAEILVVAVMTTETLICQFSHKGEVK